MRELTFGNSEVKGKQSKMEELRIDLEVLVNAWLVTGPGTGLPCTKPLEDWQAFC